MEDKNIVILKHLLNNLKPGSITADEHFMLVDGLCGENIQVSRALEGGSPRHVEQTHASVKGARSDMKTVASRVILRLVESMVMSILWCVMGMGDKRYQI